MPPRESPAIWVWETRLQRARVLRLPQPKREAPRPHRAHHGGSACIPCRPAPPYNPSYPATLRARLQLLVAALIPLCFCLLGDTAEFYFSPIMAHVSQSIPKMRPRFAGGADERRLGSDRMAA